jgi:hypothetical protein
VNEATPTPYPTLPLDMALRLDPICDRFEAAWLAGGRLRLEAFLEEAAEPDRPALLRQPLLWMGMEQPRWRWSNGVQAPVAMTTASAANVPAAVATPRASRPSRTSPWNAPGSRIVTPRASSRRRHEAINLSGRKGALPSECQPPASLGLTTFCKGDISP